MLSMMLPMMQTMVRLRADPLAASEARFVVRGALVGVPTSDEHVDVAQLLVSELVTATCSGQSIVRRSAPEEVTVQEDADCELMLVVQIGGRNLRCTVREPAQNDGCTNPDVSDFGPSGEARLLLDALATRWDVEREVMGSLVTWFELDLLAEVSPTLVPSTG